MGDGATAAGRSARDPSCRQHRCGVSRAGRRAGRWPPPPLRVLDGADVVAHCRDQHAAGRYAEWLRRPSAALGLAEAQPGGAPIGYFWLDAAQLPVPDPRDTDVELTRIDVLGRFHGTGTGAGLMAAALAAARARGLRARVRDSEGRALTRTEVQCVFDPRHSAWPASSGPITLADRQATVVITGPLIQDTADCVRILYDEVSPGDGAA